MRIYKDLEMVEYLGSGIPRILKAYPKKSFVFTDNFLRMIFPAIEIVTPQVTPQIKRLINAIDGEMSRQEIQQKIGLSDKKNFMEKYHKPAITMGVIELTIPNKPKSRLQKYRLTGLGKRLKER